MQKSVVSCYLRFGKYNMSKIGQKTIDVPNSVTVLINGQTVSVKGKLGEKNIVVPQDLSITQDKAVLLVKRSNESKRTKSLHGLYRQLIYNAVTGVDKPWMKKLEIVGTGFNVKMQGEDLVFKLGYSHPIVFKKVEGLVFSVDGDTKVIVSGLDKQLVGQIAYQIKLLRKPDVYKGKGIRYEGEKLRIKPGKKAKAAGAAA
jgi:large subunit ribosomal protein L6